MNMRKTVAIIGLGGIGCRKWGEPDNPRPFNHVGGILHSDAVHLVAAADTAQEQRDFFTREWMPLLGAVNLYDDYREMLERERPDIASVCTGTPLHYEMSCAAIDAGVRVLFLEKPMTCVLEEADDILRRAERSGTRVVVAYARHWGTHLRRIVDFVAEGHLGKVRAATGYVGGGVLHFGSHVTDMLCMFLGYSVEAVTARGRFRDEAPGVPDGYEAEPCLDSMVLEFASGVVAHHIGANSDYGEFRVDLFCERGRIRLPYHGRPLVSGTDGEPVDLDAYRQISMASEYTLAYDEIARSLDGGQPPQCDGPDALHVHEVGMAAIESMRTGLRVALPLTDRNRRVWSDGKARREHE